jgi:hypothetical protein
VKQREIHGIGLAIVGVFGLTLLSDNVFGQQKTLKEQLIGTWTPVSISEVYPDGKKDTPWGPNLTGAFHFDPDGKVMVVIIGADLANPSPMPQESKRQVVAYFGTYAVDEAAHTVTYTAQRATIPAFDGLARKATVTVNGDEMTQQSAPVTGPKGAFVPNLVLKRAK